MAETDSASPSADKTEVSGLVEATPDARQNARARAEACSHEINAALARHHCRILPRIDPAHIEPVGMTGDRVIITATFWIAPLAF